MEQDMLTVIAWCLAAGFVVVAALLARQLYVTIGLRRRVNALQADARLRDDEMRHLVQVRLPMLIEGLHSSPSDVPGPMHERLADTTFGRDAERVVRLFAEFMQTATANADKAAKATLRSMMRAIQSLANEQQLVICEMQSQHDEPGVLGDLMRIDHMNAQLGRRAQAAAVLCGSWPGQQRSDSALTDVVRGATSRIRDYLRIEVNAHADVAVVSRVVEPVVLAVAELLDNAARHSQPNTTVQVNFQQTHNGFAIVIDDAGVAMEAEELQRAAALLSGREPININRLGDPPQIGFAVIGVLAARYGFSVSVDTQSPFGGVRAVVFLPSSLLAHVESAQDAAQGTARHARPGQAAPSGSGASDPSSRPVTAGGLPKRRRMASSGPPQQPGRDQIGEQLQTPGDPDIGSPGRSARRTAAGMGAWQRGTRSGRATTSPDLEGNARP